MFVAVGKEGGLVWCPSRRVWMRLPEYRAGPHSTAPGRPLLRWAKKLTRGVASTAAHSMAGLGCLRARGAPECIRGRGLKGNSHCFSDEVEFVV